jgi:hypothetical protein
VPALPDRASGLRLTAAIYKADVTDAVNFLANPPHFVVRQTAVQAFTNNTNTNVIWDTVDVDSYSGFNAASDATAYMVQVSGWYVVTYAICWANNTTGNRSAYLQRAGVQQPGSWTSSAPSNSFPTVSCTFRVQCTAGDSLQVTAQQGSGGSLSTTNPGVGQTWWSVRWDHA